MTLICRLKCWSGSSLWCNSPLHHRRHGCKDTCLPPPFPKIPVHNHPCPILPDDSSDPHPTTPPPPPPTPSTPPPSTPIPPPHPHPIQDAVSVQDQCAPGIPVLVLEFCTSWPGLRWEGRGVLIMLSGSGGCLVSWNSAQPWAQIFGVNVLNTVASTEMSGLSKRHYCIGSIFRRHHFPSSIG